MPGKNGETKEFIWSGKRNKKWLYISLAAVVVVAGVLGFIIFGFTPSLSENNNSSEGINNETAQVRRVLDGIYVTPGQENHYPVGVMIENLTIVRPQSGLVSANLVYEALAEGGITRFLAMYTGELNSITEIGPVRSARSYYIDWISEYNALYLHAGGSPEALANIKKYNTLDLDQFRNSQYYQRDTGRQLAVEHNLFTSGEKIAFALRDKNLDGAGSFTAWKFKDDAATASRPVTEKSISIDFSSLNYKVEYKYDAVANNYLRYQGGEIIKDKNGTEIRPKNVIVQRVKTQLVDKERLGMDTVGEGDAVIFRDGQTVIGRWKKEARTERTMYYDQDGNEVVFTAGQIWVEIVPTDRDVVYN